MTKNEARKIVKIQKKQLTRDFVDTYSKKVSELFLSQKFYKDATVIYTYLEYNTEIITRYIIEQAWRDGKRVAVPKVLGNGTEDGMMEFYYINDFSSIEEGYCGIPEPCGCEEDIAEDDDVLILMPGLAFDRKLNRLGYGGGFYDRYLERRKAAGTSFFKVSLAYDFQLFEELETEAHDEKIDALITEDGIITPA